MLFKQYALKTADAILAEFGSSLSQGLSTQGVAQKIQQFGHNQQHEKESSWWHIVWHHATSMFVILFCMIDILFLCLGEWSNAIIVLLLIIINICVGCYQEFKASKTIKLLKKHIENLTWVLRDGKKIEIANTELVPGDIVFLNIGDIVPADIRILKEHNLMIDEALITGESVSIKKTDKILDEEPDLFKAFNIAFTGTLVVDGEATGIIFATAKNTIFGSLVQHSYRSWQESTLEKAVIQLSKFIFVLSMVSLVCIGVGNIVVRGYAGFNVIELLVFATALMICLVPEALPIVVTFNLSLCVRRLIKMNVVVKRLSALEDFGAVEILCVDKTGTLTEQKLKVANTFSRDLDALRMYSSFSLLPQDHQSKNSFEMALEEYLMQEYPAVLTQAADEYEFVSSTPFDPDRRRSGIFVRRKNSSDYFYVLRGAYEMMETVCFPANSEAKEWISQEGAKGHRTLAVAVKALSAVPDDLIKEERNFTLVGLLAFSDPIKRTAAVAIDQARNLGIQIKVISGDAPEVCGAVAHELLLVDDPKKVVTSKMLEQASAQEKEILVTEGSVFSRVLPDQKAEIVQILKRTKRVAFMGDGLNDLPALMTSDVALVVQGCPDVVREAGDIVLLNRSLLSVIQAIKEGRTVLANTMKYIKTTFSPSFGHFYALTIASLFVSYMPMRAIQILLLNFFSDFPMIALATDTVEPEELNRPQQYNLRSILFISVILGLVTMLFDFICFSYFIKKSESALQTGWFIETMLTEILFIFAIRSRKVFFQAQRPSFTLGICALLVAIGTLIVPYTEIGQRLFYFTALDARSLGFVFGLVILYFLCVEVIKYLYYHSAYFKNNSGTRSV